MYWTLIPMLAGLGLQGYGTYQMGEAGVTGAESEAKIQQMNRNFQNKVFRESIEKQKPFTEAGAKAIPLYSEAVRGRGEPMKGGLAQMQKNLLEKDTGSMSDYVRRMSMKRLEAEEGEKYKSRLMDLQQIGLGSSGSAGRSAVNLGSALASSYARTGEALAGAEMGQAAATQNMWAQSLDAISGLPAYYAASQRKKDSFNVPSGWGSYNSGGGFRSTWEE